MNVMKPGCQDVLKHRIPEGVHKTGVSNIRYSISWRKIVPLKDTDSDTFSPEQVTPKILASPTNSPKTRSLPKKSAILVAGDSFLERLDTTRLAKGKKNVYTVAKGGS